MEIEQLKSETIRFTELIMEKNSEMMNNSEVTEDDMTQLIEYTAHFAEITSQYAKRDAIVIANCPTSSDSKGRKALFEAAESHLELKSCYYAKIRMDHLWINRVQPFFRLTQVANLYSAISNSCYDMNYIIPANEDSRMIKKNLLSKIMCVSFEIWKHQFFEDSDYKHDKKSDVNTLQEALALYKADGNKQFVPELDSLLGWIEQNSKGSSTKNGRQTRRTEKRA